MKTTLKSLQSLNPALINNSFKPKYRPRNTEALLPIQKAGLDKLLFGLRGYSPEELKNMTEEDKRAVIYTTDHAWQIINKMKQERLNKFLGSILHKVFGNSLCGNMTPFLLAPVTDSTFQVSQDIREVNVPLVDIAREFVKRGLLPKTFMV